MYKLIGTKNPKQICIIPLFVSTRINDVKIMLDLYFSKIYDESLFALLFGRP